MVKHLAREGAPGEGSEEGVCETCETPSSERASGAGGANAFGEAKTSETKTSGAARFAADGSDTIGALLRCTFRADPRQVTYALKLSSACAAAGVLGWAVSGNGSWAALTVAMVGTREGEAVGGSFNAALLRMQGTVIGAMFSFALVVLLSGDLASGAGAGRLILLAGFAFLTTYLRLNAEYAYAGIVAAFTAYVVALGIPDDADVQTARSYAHKRIEQNLLGLVVLIVVEVFLFPTFAHDAARVAAANTVESARVAAETVYDATVGTDCARCRERAADDAQGALDAVESKLGAQKTLLVQAAAEPHLWSPAFPLAAHQTLATDLENVRRILGLMREALRAMATSESERQKKRGGAVGGEDSPTLTSTSFSRNGDGDADPRAQVAALLTPTDGYVTNLRRAVRAFGRRRGGSRLGRGAVGNARGVGVHRRGAGGARARLRAAHAGDSRAVPRGRRFHVFAQSSHGALARVHALHARLGQHRRESRRGVVERPLGGETAGEGGGEGGGFERRGRSARRARGGRREDGRERRRVRGRDEGDRYGRHRSIDAPDAASELVRGGRFGGDDDHPRTSAREWEWRCARFQRGERSGVSIRRVRCPRMRCDATRGE